MSLETTLSLIEEVMDWDGGGLMEAGERVGLSLGYVRGAFDFKESLI